MRALSARRSTGFALAAVLVLAACDDDATGPSMEEVAGTYVATSLTATLPGSSPVDVLALDAELTLELDADGTAAGHLFAPGMGDGGGDLDADLAGTWTLNGNTVTLSSSADTFVRDMPLTVSGETLVGDRTFDGVRIRVTLTRQ